MKREFMRYMAGVSAGVFLAGTPAFAADLAPVLAPAPVPAFTWTGFELGAQVGGGAGQTNVNLPPYAASYGSSGVFGGIHVGFNYQVLGPIVIGLQGEYNFAGITGSASAPPLNYLNSAVRQFGSADARLGYAIDHVLIYAIGGFAYGDLRSIVNYGGAPGIVGFPLNRSFDGNRYGYDVGGGIEYNFWGNWTARAEYRYYNFGSLGFNDAGFGAPLSNSIPNHRSQDTMQTGRLGLTYKFDWGSTPVVAKY